MEKDPQYAEAHAYLGEIYLHFLSFGLMPTVEALDKACINANSKFMETINHQMA